MRTAGLADPNLLLNGDTPRLIDEWRLGPAVRLPVRPSPSGVDLRKPTVHRGHRDIERECHTTVSSGTGVVVRPVGVSHDDTRPRPW